MVYRDTYRESERIFRAFELTEPQLVWIHKILRQILTLNFHFEFCKCLIICYLYVISFT